MEKIKVMLDPGAIMPTVAYGTSAAMDLYSMEDAVIFRDGSHIFNTGVHIALPDGCCGMLVSKSGLNFNNGLQSDGLIDPDYRGVVHVKLYNHGNEMVKIKKGQKISQLLILPFIKPEIKLVDKLDKTERGNNGFGSSGAMHDALY